MTNDLFTVRGLAFYGLRLVAATALGAILGLAAIEGEDFARSLLAPTFTSGENYTCSAYDSSVQAAHLDRGPLVWFSDPSQAEKLCVDELYADMGPSEGTDLRYRCYSC